MTRPLPSAFVISAVSVAVMQGCVSVQDLGSHGPRREGGAPNFDASTPTGGGPVKVFFVTDGHYSGDLAGVAGADAICGAEARGASLAGVFKAWVSTSTENAASRIAPVGPWRLVEGTIVFDGPSVGVPRVFPRYTATGVDLFFSDDTKVWTGTDKDGKLSINRETCAGWTSGLAKDKGSFGTLTRISGAWTDDQGFDTTSLSSPCSERLRLYCFEQ